MKKLLFFLTLILSIFCTAKAGYLIRGVTTFIDPSYLKNYTLTFDGNGEPIAAASMLQPGTGRESIVVVQANNTRAYLFPVNIDIENLPIEVRDFHYLNYDDSYILCGSRGIGTNARAFVARINRTLSSMDFMEYTEANIFYSIWDDWLYCA